MNIFSFFQQKVELHQNVCFTHTIYFQCEKWFCLSCILQYLQQKDCFWKRRQLWDGLVKHINCYTKTYIQSIQPLSLISGNHDVPIGDKGIFSLQTTTEWCRQNRQRWISCSVIRNMRGHRPQMISLPFLCLKRISLSWASSTSHYYEPQKQASHLIKICSGVQLLHAMTSSIVSWPIFWALRVKKLETSCPSGPMPQMTDSKI